MIGVGRGLLRLRESAAGMVADGYERLARRPFPRLRPRPLWYEKPLYYKGNPATFIGDGDTVRWPAYAQALDYELEVGVVIARDCSDLTREEALGVAGGFVLLNDFSARDVQFREMVEGLMGPAKSKDFGTALGSVVVTADEFLSTLDELTVEVRVNGERWGVGRTAGMQHSVAHVIAYASAGEQLEAGTVIGLGTVPGCSGIETGRWLSPGDVVELSAGPLGRLLNTVGEPEPWRQAGPVTRARWSIVIRAGEQADPQGDPAPWTPPRAPALTGVLAPNQVLDQVERWEVPGGTRPEDVVFDAAGRLYAGVEDGRIWRWPATYPDSGPAELFADTHGRPLGLEIDPRDGTLIVCDAYRGLLKTDEAGHTRVLADTYAGSRLRFTNNAAVAADGTVYFSDSSTRFRIEHLQAGPARAPAQRPRLPLPPGRRPARPGRGRPVLPERRGPRPGRVVPAGRADRWVRHPAHPAHRPGRRPARAVRLQPAGPARQHVPGRGLGRGRQLLGRIPVAAAGVRRPDYAASGP